MTRTEYVVWVQGSELHRGEALEEAIRVWDGATYNRVGITPGGITVQTWNDDVMVRDGWILHVFDNGQVFLNPNVKNGETDTQAIQTMTKPDPWREELNREPWTVKRDPFLCDCGMPAGYHTSDCHMTVTKG